MKVNRQFNCRKGARIWVSLSATDCTQSSHLFFSYDVSSGRVHWKECQLLLYITTMYVRCVFLMCFADVYFLHFGELKILFSTSIQLSVRWIYWTFTDVWWFLLVLRS